MQQNIKVITNNKSGKGKCEQLLIYKNCAKRHKAV